MRTQREILVASFSFDLLDVFFRLLAGPAFPPAAHLTIPSAHTPAKPSHYVYSSQFTAYLPLAALVDLKESNGFSDDDLLAHPERITSISMFMFNFPRIACMHLFPHLRHLQLPQQVIVFRQSNAARIRWHLLMPHPPCSIVCCLLRTRFCSHDFTPPTYIPVPIRRPG